VSRLCLRTMNFGPHTTEEGSFQIMDTSLDSGLNFFDTADVYRWEMGEGITEQIIGRWLKQGGRRDKIVLTTKVYGGMGEGVNDRGLSAYHIIQACNASLKRLETDIPFHGSIEENGDRLLAKLQCFEYHSLNIFHCEWFGQGEVDKLCQGWLLFKKYWPSRQEQNRCMFSF